MPMLSRVLVLRFILRHPARIVYRAQPALNAVPGTAGRAIPAPAAIHYAAHPERIPEGLPAIAPVIAAAVPAAARGVGHHFANSQLVLDGLGVEIGA